MNIGNEIALVTGANRGVGKEYVVQLLDRGAQKIYACARDIAKLDSIVELDPARVVPIKLDVTNQSDIENAAKTASDVTFLINNAGSLTFGGALDISDEGLSQDMSVNNDGLRNMTRAFTPVLKANGGGTIVNMLSLLSFLSAPCFSGYNASKAAAWSMTMSLRPYLRAKGITVINAFPAGIDTEMLAGIDGPKDNVDAVVTDVLNGVSNGVEDVYPASAKGIYASWRDNQKAVEAAFAEMM